MTNYNPEGNAKVAKIVYIAEAPSTQEMIEGRPLAGPSGRIFNSLLHQVGLIRSNAYITNLFDVPVYKPWQKPEIYLENTFETLLWTPGRGFTSEALRFRNRLVQELEGCEAANIFVTLGAPAMEALSDKRGILKHRGSVICSHILGDRKMMPTIHPAATMRGQYLWRHLIAADLERAKREGEFPEIIRPAYRFSLNPTYDQIMTTLGWLIEDKPLIAVDTEVENSQMSLVSIAWNDLDCIVIGFDKSWQLEQHANIMLKFAQLMEDPDVPKIFQNNSFDRSFLLNVHKILVRGRIEDTMVKHHIMYPDFRKNLALLTSLYTDQPYYKDLVHVRADAIANKEG